MKKRLEFSERDKPMKKQRKIRFSAISLLLLLAIFVNLAGCVSDLWGGGEDSESKVQNTEQPTNEPDEKEPLELTAIDLMAGIEANAVSTLEDLSENNVDVVDFAVRLFKETNEEGRSTLISPISVLYALAMAANGAEGETRAQIEETIGMSIEELNLYLYSYTSALPQGEKYKLNLANSVWFTDDSRRFTVNQEFLQKNADYYGADIFKAPFNDQTLNDINKWAEYNTDGLIKKALDEMDSDAVMYIVNALLFDAEWARIYDEDSVLDSEFKMEDGTKKDIQLMHSEEGRYLEDETATGFIKPYSGGKYAFVALLPKEGVTVAEYAEMLDGESLSELLSGVRYCKVNAALPKFESSYDSEMSDVIEGMGIVDAFDSGAADFSGLGESGMGNIYVNRVIHKTYIEVGELGTRAGAVTIIEAVNESITIEPPKSVILDRPFLYMIIDCENNIPIFIGTMMGD